MAGRVQSQSFKRGFLKFSIPLFLAIAGPAIAARADVPATPGATTATPAPPAAVPTMAPPPAVPSAPAPSLLTPPPALPSVTLPPPPALPSADIDAALPVAGETDYRVTQMFLDADIVVKAVIVFLGLCSFITWAVLIEKSLTVAQSRWSARRFLARFRRAGKLAEIGDKVGATRNCPMGRMWQAADTEWRQSMALRPREKLTGHQIDRMIQRMVLAAGVAQELELSRLGSAMGLLATIGSTAPFIGLFGTVWGIMHSFGHIAVTKSTSLAVVAPGIAEALLATAIGLFAAIPATMFYNRFARSISQITGSLDNFTAEFVAFASRELEMEG